jgi:hypothetical protein
MGYLDTLEMPAEIYLHEGYFLAEILARKLTAIL